MAAVLKKSVVAEASEPSRAVSPIYFAGADNQVSPIPSPARELQETLARRLQDGQKTHTDMAIGVLAGTIGSACILSLLIYAAV